jgi:hypothetical protein
MILQTRKIFNSHHNMFFNVFINNRQALLIQFCETCFSEFCFWNTLVFDSQLPIVKKGIDFFLKCRKTRNIFYIHFDTCLSQIYSIVINMSIFET